MMTMAAIATATAMQSVKSTQIRTAQTHTIPTTLFYGRFVVCLFYDSLTLLWLCFAPLCNGKNFSHIHLISLKRMLIT